ncbi:MAG: hypothetical protein NVSMB5_01940 [Candidatus Velthaea sp.]
MLAVGNGKPVVSLPGNPASAPAVTRRIGRPLVRYLGGESGGGYDDGVENQATLTLNVPSRFDMHERVAPNDKLCMLFVASGG